MDGGPLSSACRHSPEAPGGRTPFGVDCPLDSSCIPSACWHAVGRTPFRVDCPLGNSCIPSTCWHAGGCWEKVLGQDVALGGSNANWEVTAVTLFVIGQVEQGLQYTRD